MSRLAVDKIVGANTESTVDLSSLSNIKMPAGHVLQAHYDHPTSYGITNDTSSFNVNNGTSRGDASLTFTRKQANSFFLVKVGCSVNRGATTGEFKVGYRLNSGSDVVTYCTDNDRTVRVFVEFKDTTTGSIGDSMVFESVFNNTASHNDGVSRISFSVMEIAQ